jgi:hypothetical protein
MHCQRTIGRSGASLGLALCAMMLVMILPQPASAHHMDITLLQDAGGRLVTGISEFGSTSYAFPVRVYEGGFENNVTFLRSNDPGFQAPGFADGLPAGLSLLPADTGVTFAVRAFHLPGVGSTNLAYWDGTGDVTFAPVPSGYSLSMTAVKPGTAVADGSPVDVPGFLFAETDEDGGLHEHVLFDLTNSGGNVAEGIYLWSLGLAMPGLTASEQFFILHETPLAPLTLDDAVDWTNANLDLLTVPEPSSLMSIIACAAAALEACCVHRRGMH